MGKEGARRGRLAAFGDAVGRALDWMVFGSARGADAAAIAACRAGEAERAGDGGEAKLLRAGARASLERARRGGRDAELTARGAAALVEACQGGPEQREIARGIAGAARLDGWEAERLEGLPRNPLAFLREMGEDERGDAMLPEGAAALRARKSRLGMEGGMRLEGLKACGMEPEAAKALGPWARARAKQFGMALREAARGWGEEEERALALRGALALAREGSFEDLELEDLPAAWAGRRSKGERSAARDLMGELAGLACWREASEEEAEKLARAWGMAARDLGRGKGESGAERAGIGGDGRLDLLEAVARGDWPAGAKAAFAGGGKFAQEALAELAEFDQASKKGGEGEDRAREAAWRALRELLRMGPEGERLAAEACEERELWAAQGWTRRGSGAWRGELEAARALLERERLEAGVAEGVRRGARRGI